MDEKVRKQRLSDLLLQVERGDIQQAQEQWGGAGVVISITPPQVNGNDLYPNTKYVVTNHSLALSWVLEQIGKIFSGMIKDPIDNFVFYGGLADAANRYIESRGGDKAALLAAVINEAGKYLELDD